MNATNSGKYRYEFEDADCAQKAIEALHGKDLRTDEDAPRVYWY